MQPTFQNVFKILKINFDNPLKTTLCIRKQKCKVLLGAMTSNQLLLILIWVC